MSSTTIHQYLYFAVFVIFAFVGVQQLTFRRKLQLNYFLAVLFLAGGYNMLYYWAYSTGLLGRAPILINTEICAAYLIGPALYLYFSSLMGEKQMPPRLLFRHGVSFLISLVIIVALNFTDESVAAHYSVRVLPVPDYGYDPVVFVTNLLCDISILGYFLTAAFKTISILKDRKVTRETRSIIIFLISFSVSAFLLILASSIRSPTLLQISIVFLSIIPLGFIFFSFRYPDYAIKVLRETRTLRSSRARETSRRVELIKAELDRLMDESKIYRESDLSLHSLSRELSVTPHELSYILNNELHRNFSSYINSFRIEDAKSMILNHHHRNITEIAFEVGFRSISAFYQYFTRETGVSPMKFKRRNESS